MEARPSIRAAFSVARTEYIKWITNPRLIIAGVLIIFIYTFATEPLLERADKFGAPLNILEPFIAAGNSSLLIMFIPSVFLVLISDYPIIGGNTIFIIKRTGRINFLTGHLIFIELSILSYIGVILLASCITSGGVISTEWSDVITKYESVFPMEAGNFVSQLIPSNLYNQMPIGEALFHTAVLINLYLIMLTLIIYMFKMLYLRTAGVFSAFAVIALGGAAFSLKIPIMWALPMANAVIWYHYDRILSAQVFPVAFSYAYFAVLNIALITANYLIIRKMQFINIETEGQA